MPDQATLKAYQLLQRLRDGSEAWERQGWAVPTLPEDCVKLLQRAAHGKPVEAKALGSVLEATRVVVQHLSWRVLGTGDHRTRGFGAYSDRET